MSQDNVVTSAAPELFELSYPTSPVTVGKKKMTFDRSLLQDLNSEFPFHSKTPSLLSTPPLASAYSFFVLISKSVHTLMNYTWGNLTQQAVLRFQVDVVIFEASNLGIVSFPNRKKNNQPTKKTSTPKPTKPKTNHSQGWIFAWFPFYITTYILVHLISEHQKIFLFQTEKKTDTQTQQLEKTQQSLLSPCSHSCHCTLQCSNIFPQEWQIVLPHNHQRMHTLPRDPAYSSHLLLSCYPPGSI